MRKVKQRKAQESGGGKYVTKVDENEISAFTGGYQKGKHGAWPM